MTQADIQNLADGLQGESKLIETHISWVILTGEFAYKIKKPLRCSFLDFSTLPLREACCRRELELNRRLAAAMYLEVVPVYKSGAQIGWNPAWAVEGELVDWALKMKRMDGELEMDRMLLQGKIDLAYMQGLAHTIARFHQGATVIDSPQQSNAKGYSADFNDILTHREAFLQHLGPENVRELNRITELSDAYLSTHADLIAARAASGMVRDVHGDLHTRNIFAYPEPVIFDCIEFNDHFRQIDVLNEVAFLCMDLEANAFEGHSQAFLTPYLTAFPAISKPEETLLLTWFKCYRANVRAKVAALRAAQNNDAACVAEMAAYLALMGRYADALQ